MDLVGLFKGKHNVLTSELEMDDSTSREHILRLITGNIATEREALTCVSDPHALITKASLTFPAKV